VTDAAAHAPLDRATPPPGLESVDLASEPGQVRQAQKAFAHASEAEMSRILDFYGVDWRYEPTTFPILWNLDGEVVESFSPDFYLPEFDLYLEMTTLKQSLVRKKNRKLRRLRELYPDIRIKLFYARDFRAMLLKYGRFGLAQSLSGTSGQLVGGELPSERPDAMTADLDEVAPAVRLDTASPEPLTTSAAPTSPRRRATRAARTAARSCRAVAGHRPVDPA
jgi:hypothetical protein